MNGHHNGGRRVHMIGKAAQVDLVEQRIMSTGMYTGGVGPERIAFITADGRQRRTQRQHRAFPPLLLRCRPAEHCLGEDIAVRIAHRHPGGDIGAGGHPEIAQFVCNIPQGLRRRTNIGGRLDRYRIIPAGTIASASFYYYRQCSVARAGTEMVACSLHVRNYSRVPPHPQGI